MLASHARGRRVQNWAGADPSIEARMNLVRRASLAEAWDGTAACGFVQGEPSLTEPSGGFFDM